MAVVLSDVALPLGHVPGWQCCLLELTLTCIITTALERLICQKEG